MKSHVSVLHEAVIRLCNESNVLCSTRESDRAKDEEYLISRSKHEGESFFTITLPAFCVDFDRSLAEGRIAPTYFRAFRKCGRIPSFLRGIVGLVFSPTGELVQNPDVTAIHSVRMISNMLKKVLLPCAEKRMTAAFKNFERLEQSLEKIPDEFEPYVQRVADFLWSGLEKSYIDSSLTPKHGPGAVYERISGNQKYVFKTWPDDVESVLPMYPNAIPSLDGICDDALKDISVCDGSLLKSRLTAVPKTLKGPRLIAIEPIAKQYAQQALLEVLDTYFQSSPLCAGHVNIHDQGINQTLAMASSVHGQLATLDLSDASDNVKNSLVNRMLDSCPSLRDAVQACRTRHVQLPDHKTLMLRKHASMGSALCFPIESMYFYTICVAAQLENTDLPVTFKAVVEAAKKVYIYGDDIVVPTDRVESTIALLAYYGNKVNTRKSYWTGKFRESCGWDCFDGKLVNPVYVRTAPPDGRRSVTELVSWCQTGNQFAMSGFFDTAEFFFRRVEKFIGKLPYAPSTSPVMCRWSEAYGRSRDFHGYDRLTQRRYTSGYGVVPVYRKDPIDGYPALLKCLLSLERRRENTYVESDKRHLHRSARYRVVAMRRLKAW